MKLRADLLQFYTILFAYQVLNFDAYLPYPEPFLYREELDHL